MPHRPMNREQVWLLPPNPDDWLSPRHPARFVSEFVDTLSKEEWSEIGIDLGGSWTGAPSYDPRAMMGAWVFAFMTGVRTSRQLESACREQVPFMWLTGRQHPDHVTLWRFYDSHRDGMRKLLKKTVDTALKMKLVKLALQAVDGTKVEANAASDRTYGAAGLRRLLEQLDLEIDELEAQNEAGEESSAELPESLSARSALRKQIREALGKVEDGDRKDVNLTDEDARFMKSRRGIVQAYNAQAMVSPVEGDAGETGMLITAVDVVDEPNDASQLVPMMEKAEETTGEKADLTLADAGYHSGSALEGAARREQSVAMPESQDRALESPYHKDRFVHDETSDEYECPEGQRLRFARIKQTRGTPMRLYRASGAVCRACPAFGVCTKDGRHGRALEIGPHEELLRRHRDWMSTDEAIAAYGKRMHLVEAVFGIIKEQQGGRRFLLRGLEKVISEWTLLATAFNLRTLCRMWQGATGLSGGPGPAPQRNSVLGAAGGGFRSPLPGLRMLDARNRVLGPAVAVASPAFRMAQAIIAHAFAAPRSIQTRPSLA